MVWNDAMLRAWIDGVPGGWRWLVWIGVVAAGAAVALWPFALMKCGARLDRAMCKEGRVDSGLGGLPGFVAFAAALWRAIPAAYALWNRHAAWHGSVEEYERWAIGVDFTEKVPYAFPWGTEVVPEELGLIFDALRVWWHVPLVAVGLVWLLRSWKFRSPLHAALDAAAQAAMVLCIYWVGGVLMGGYWLQFAVRGIVATFLWVFGILAVLGVLGSVFARGGGAAIEHMTGTEEREREQVWVDDGSGGGVTLTQEENGVQWKDQYGRYWRRNFDGTFEHDGCW